MSLFSVFCRIKTLLLTSLAFRFLSRALAWVPRLPTSPWQVTTATHLISAISSKRQCWSNTKCWWTSRSRGSSNKSTCSWSSRSSSSWWSRGSNTFWLSRWEGPAVLFFFPSHWFALDWNSIWDLVKWLSHYNIKNVTCQVLWCHKYNHFFCVSMKVTQTHSSWLPRVFFPVTRHCGEWKE